MSRIDCGSFVDEYSPLLRATMFVSEHIATKKPLLLRWDCDGIIKVTERLKQEHPEMVSADILNMIEGSAKDILGMIDLASEQGKPMQYDIISQEGNHLQMLTLEAMILDTARCAVREK